MTGKREISDFDCFSPAKKTKRNSSNGSMARWTEEELKLLCSLKQQGNTFKELMTYFPGRTEKALIRAMERRGQEVKEEFTAEKDAALKHEIETFQKNMWVHIGRSLGMTPAGCKRRAMEKSLFK